MIQKDLKEEHFAMAASSATPYMAMVQVTTVELLVLVLAVVFGEIGAGVERAAAPSSALTVPSDHTDEKVMAAAC